MYYLNKGLRPDSNTTDDWIGTPTALNRLITTNPRNPNTPFGQNYYYWAADNANGIRISSDGSCWWDWQSYLGQDIEMYFGYKRRFSLV